MDWTLFGVISTAVGIIITGLVRVMSGRQKTTCKECFKELKEKLDGHETRITVTETQLQEVFRAIEGIRADIKEILRILRER